MVFLVKVEPSPKKGSFIFSRFYDRNLEASVEFDQKKNPNTDIKELIEDIRINGIKSEQEILDEFNSSKDNFDIIEIDLSQNNIIIEHAAKFYRVSRESIRQNSDEYTSIKKVKPKRLNMVVYE